MDPGDIVLLVAGGLAAGVVNTLAGGGSLLTVPLLVLAGVPGNVANGSNRVGILASNASATAAFHRLGVSGLSRTLPVLVPVAIGSLVGALLVARLADETFERAFGVLMVPLLLLSLRPPVSKSVEGRVWSGPFTVLVFVNDPDLVPTAYRRYLESFFRRRFDLGPAPVRVRLRARARRGSGRSGPAAWGRCVRRPPRRRSRGHAPAAARRDRGVPRAFVSATRR